ncbi:MAG: ral nucleoside transport system permease protein [Chloroflexota bacterium]|jgi:simple sugar transport system permease protein|nr:ral nucleoside transport system permease protein [Chloroflexota bacterium]
MDALVGVLDVALVASTIRLFTPILLAGLGGLVTARVGIFNIALEGLMLFGAFFAVVGTAWTGQPLVGLVFAVVAAVLVSLIFAVVVVDLGGDAIVAGLAVNMLALGATTYLMLPLFGVEGSFYDPTLQRLPQVTIPVVGAMPIVGSLLSGYSILVYVAFALVVVLQVLLFRHPLGIRIRAVGEQPLAAASVGVSVRGLRYLAIVVCGIMCGLAGAELSISLVTQFVIGMTAGRGFIALVAVMFGRAHPLGVLAASLIFGFMYALTLRLQGAGSAPQFVAMLPYLVTIAVLVAVAIRQRRAQANRARTAIDDQAGIGPPAVVGSAGVPPP